MTLTPLTFEKLAGSEVAPTTVLLTRERLETIRQEALKAGRDVARQQIDTAETSQREAALAALKGAASDLMFTHVEARAAVLNGLAPLLIGLVTKIIPEIARTNLPALISEEVAKISNHLQTGPVRVICAAGQAEPLKDLLGEVSGDAGFLISEDASLQMGQCRILGGETELQVDLPTLLDGFHAAIRDLVKAPTKEAGHAG